MAFGPLVGEQKHEYLVLKKVKGLNTQPSREAIGEDEFIWLENMMPIGDAFIKAVPQRGPAIATATAQIGLQHSAVIGTTAYMICFTTAGGAQAVNLTSSAVITIASGGTFSTGYPSMDQWKSERIVIADPANGYFTWDGTLLNSPGTLATISVSVTGSGYTSTPSVTLTGGTAGTTASAQAILSSGGIGQVSIVSVGAGYTAAPSVGFSGGGGSGSTASAFIMPNGLQGQSIAVYSGRVWIGNNRTLNFTAPGTWYDVDTADAAGSSVITEGSLKLRIYAMEALDNYLYVFGDSSIIVIGDVKVTNSITTFSQTFLSSTTGTTLPQTITAMERAVLFCNQEGVYALVGASLQKISKQLDGLFPSINFDSSVQVTAGLATIYNIQCYALNFRYTGSLNGSTNDRNIQALFFDGKWFLTSQGDIQFVASSSSNGIQTMWGTTGTDVRQLYADTTQTIATTLMTGLYDLGSPIFDKQVIRAGIEWSAPSQDQITLEIDTESVTQTSAFASDSGIIWFNNSNQQITWINNALQTVVWITNGFILSDGLFDVTGKYLGATATSNNAGIAVNGILMEYVRRAPWNR